MTDGAEPAAVYRATLEQLAAGDFVHPIEEFARATAALVEDLADLDPQKVAEYPREMLGGLGLATPASPPSFKVGPISRLPADPAHGPRRGPEARLVDAMLELLAPHGVADDFLQLGVVGAGAKRSAQVGLVHREKARP
jgi:hypothetical protein